MVGHKFLNRENLEQNGIAKPSAYAISHHVAYSPYSHQYTDTHAVTWSVLLGEQGPGPDL
jgi:hypothetical protein